MQDPLFSASVLKEGCQLGASMELDLRARADSGFAVLHDAMLGDETDGAGEVRTLSRADLASLRHRDAPRPILVSEDLADLLTGSHPDALVQLDMKDDLDVIGQRGVDHLADHFGSTGPTLIISGSCQELMLAIARRLPAVRRGIDPTDKLVAIYHGAGLAAVEAELSRDLRGPIGPDTVYLAWELVLQAATDGLDMVALCRESGCRVDAWTFTPADPEGLSDAETETLRRLLALRPDQITTDEAILLEQASRSLG